MTALAQVAADLRPGAALVCRVMVLSVAAVDLSILTRWIGGATGALPAIGAHLACVLLLGLVAVAINRRASPHVALLALVLAMAGPLGSFMILIAGLDAPSRARLGARPAAPRAAAESEAPSPVDALFASLRQGRRADGGAHRLHSLDQTFRTGSLADQQGALKAISRGYDPAMLPALRLALGSPRPAVRVQAAAVFARLRGLFAERAKAALACDPATLPGAAAVAWAEECRTVAASGFVNPDVAEALVQRAGLRPAPGLPVPVDDRTAPGRAPLFPPPRLKRHACGGVA